ncbi:MAG: ATP-binding protein [Planctomycetota bacterium]
MQDFEKLGAFYFGKIYDQNQRKVTDELVLYDAKDLTTHAVCVGMTGSGKTGLCLSLLEEAAIDGIPAICIDPKGDLGNLLLTFPNLLPADFRPWIDTAEATRQGLSPEEFAQRTAETWKAGLKEWGQDGARIQRFKDAVDISIYTPASNAGIPLTVLRTFTVPSAATLQNNEALRERVSAAAAGVLALVGIDVDPLQSREHILLSNLLDRSWRAGQDVDLPGLIRAIQQPPFDKIGILDLESFYPAKARFSLAMSLNNLIASPGFAAWTEGDPLDIQKLLYTAEGKPRLSIISIAHLSDSERMFFVTILLNEMIAWMRNQTGTSSLRALLYMDEVFGYFPPTANPPSKTPMLTLLKQARAFGLGVVLATQNPVDLDYKGLSNAGTWFLGRLQTERDKARVLEGLEGASAAAGAQFDRQKMERILAGLGNRVFLMNNVHEDQPVVFQSRWALSYLRGPINREQISTLMQAKKEASGQSAKNGSSTSGAAVSDAFADARPVVAPGIDEVFLPSAKSVPPGAKLLYRPGLLGAARIQFSQTTAGIDCTRDVSFILPAVDQISPTLWDEAILSLEQLEQQTAPLDAGDFTNLPSDLNRPKTYTELGTALKDHIYRTQRLKVYRSAELKATSNPDEAEGDFRIRITQGIKEQRDQQVEKLRAKYTPKLATLQEQLRRAQQRVEKEQSQANASTMTAAVQVGASVLGALFGRKLASATNVSKAVTSVRAATRVMNDRKDIGMAEDTVEAVQQRWKDLDAQFQAEAAKIVEGANPESLKLDEVSLTPKKTDIKITQMSLAWVPWIVDGLGNGEPAF